MKRTERRHLKQNEFQDAFNQTVDMLGERRSEVTTTLLVVAVIGLAAAIGYAWYQHRQDNAHELLAQAMVVQEARVGPPAEATGGSGGLSFPTDHDRTQAAVAKFKAAADAYPGTDAGLYARYQEASLQVSLGNTADAIKAYQDVVTRSGDGLYGQMSKLGLAEAYARAGQYEQAITQYKELVQRKDGQIPIDGVLIELGRAYRDAGKSADAQQTFNRVVEEFPESPFMQDAKRELDALKKAKAA
ncbi:MAG TPA: tetratricopeptide repeat protein [Vicinamibacterales bacterium]|nr:tetratricopeptide repeat protein [Vicinamibacterales bacterium]